MTICGEWADINVWRISDGELVNKVWDASDEDLDELEQFYADDPDIDIQVEDR